MIETFVYTVSVLAVVHLSLRTTLFFLCLSGEECSRRKSEILCLDRVRVRAWVSLPIKDKMLCTDLFIVNNTKLSSSQ